jgi:hypothetical protein
MRTPPRNPGEADWINTGLFFSGCSGTRETQSSAFFRTPGTE